MAKKKKKVVPAKIVVPSNNSTFGKSKTSPAKVPPVVKPKDKSFTDFPYPYHKHINTPSKLKMSEDGTLSALSNNISGLISYVELLIAGSGKASATGKPLGDRYFINTGSKCLDKKTKKRLTDIFILIMFQAALISVLLKVEWVRIFQKQKV